MFLFQRVEFLFSGRLKPPVHFLSINVNCLFSVRPANNVILSAQWNSPVKITWENNVKCLLILETHVSILWALFQRSSFISILCWLITPTTTHPTPPLRQIIQLQPVCPDYNFDLMSDNSLGHCLSVIPSAPTAQRRHLLVRNRWWKRSITGSILTVLPVSSSADVVDVVVCSDFCRPAYCNAPLLNRSIVLLILDMYSHGYGSF